MGQQWCNYNRGIGIGGPQGPGPPSQNQADAVNANRDAYAEEHCTMFIKMMQSPF